ncbi:MAG: LamG domain-containing protein [Chloroflexi bacterium]|nr:LamG domain-containing protein [Chloroflexota bacterium]MYG90211.1 LamG domain-containing protein [Chloroflexota bacterium]MYJ93932.1 LamG domain-containing protein [Chloroflexota bacterium]
MLEKKIAGYSDEISVAPGERIRFMVSCEPGVDRYRADIVRLISGDRQPEGPGYRDELLPTSVSGEYPGRSQETYCGSYAVVPDGPAFDALSDLSLQAVIFPTLPALRRASVISKMDIDAGCGFALWTDPDNGLVLQLGDGQGGLAEFALGQPLVAREWYLVSATYDSSSGEVRLRQQLLDSYARDTSSGEARHDSERSAVVGCNAPLLIAAASREEARGKPVGEMIFNGRIERPVVASRVLERSEMESLRSDAVPRGLRTDICAAWDFSRAMETDDIIDISPNRAHGRLINLPIRAVRGSNWTGAELDFNHAPEQYAAIHFLDDSLYDCEWDADFELEVPADTPSGLYAARLTAGDQEDHVTFVVRPPRDRATASLALLIPTASYMAYGNSRGGIEFGNELLSNHLAVIGPEERYLNRHPEYGNSMYDNHNDGTGVCYSSRLRPLINIRPTHHWLWQLSADMHLVEWLEAQGIAFDVITDEDMHQDGVSLLERYSCVMTCSHPEYYSTNMWDAVHAFTQRGGRLMYMGGNGFYWRVAYRDDKPGAMEMRRTEDGSRSWASEPGEYFMAFTGEYGGLWWRAGRTPQSLVGNGFIAQGFDHSSYFRRTADSHDPRAKFIFDGIDDEIIGDFGLIGGGAAGLELDSASRGYGTPPHALTVATSEQHTDCYIRVNEDIGHMLLSIGGQDDPQVHADVVFFETPRGGAVFSTGSIGWSSALFHNDHDNNVSRMTRNVLDRFLDPAPFE